MNSPIPAPNEVADESRIAPAPAKTAPAALFPIPNLIFENRTPLDATQFDAVDQHGSSFHVVVAKTAYLLGARDIEGRAALTPVFGATLNVEDRHFDDDQHASVRQESDFAPYKPACDVIVNATAYAPGGKPRKAFLVRLTVQGNPPVSSPDNARPAVSAQLIDKTLSISGERSFQKKTALWRMAQWTGRIASAGMLQPNPWRLSRAHDASDLPLRYEYASGGQCRIDHGDHAAVRVRKPARIASDDKPGLETTEEGNAISIAVAHEASEENPCGRGFARRWYLDAKRLKAYSAPRINAHGTHLTARQFWRAANGSTLPAPVGLGTVGRGWLPRRALAGTFVAKASWGEDEVPCLPNDFDFAYYNCAPRDQQCPYLSGQELFSLLNLCSRDHPSGTVDQQGNTVLRFTLPQQALFLLAADGGDQLMIESLVIDTVTIEPDENRVDLVWRALLPTDADLRVARLLHITEVAQLARLDEVLQAQAGLGNGSASSLPVGTRRNDQ